jgi:hypothetical protein
VPLRKLEPGAVLIREWGGIKYRVVVVDGGGDLSAIQRSAPRTSA